MKSHRLIAHGLWVGLLLTAVGCSGLQNADQKWQPYRSATLNHDYSSSYPRPTAADPFGLESEGDEQNDPSQVALAEPPDDGGAALQGEREQQESQAPSAYRPDDAAAYISTVYAANETQVTESNEANPTIVDVYRHTQREGTIYHSNRPAVGDLVFFHNTYDRNGDGRNNDWYTHVGLVESVDDDDGNISILSYLDGRVSRTHVNLEEPDDSHSASGDVINTVMRRRSEDDPPYTQYLASELFAGFGSLLGERTEFVVIDNWRPGMSVAAAD